MKIKRSFSSLCDVRQKIIDDGGDGLKKLKDLEARKSLNLPCDKNGVGFEIACDFPICFD